MYAFYILPSLMYPVTFPCAAAASSLLYFLLLNFSFHLIILYLRGEYNNLPFPPGTRRPRWSCTRCERGAKWEACGRRRSAHIWAWTCSGGARFSLGNSRAKAPPSHQHSPARDRPSTLSRSSRTAAPSWTTRLQRTLMCSNGGEKGRKTLYV